MKLLSIIILQYNNSQLTIDLIKSIYEMENEIGDWDIYVVDNNSTEEDMFEIMKKSFPDIMFIKHQKNLGFGGGINAVVGQVYSKYVLLINNDMLLLNNAISLTLNVAISTDVDAISCKILGPDGNPQNTTNLRLSTLNIFLSLFGLMKLFHVMKNRTNNLIRVGYINGAFLMIKVSTFKRIEMFNDSLFFMYGEDIDLMLRLNKEGANMLYSPKGKVKHLDGASALKVWGNDDKYMLKIKNSLKAHKVNKSELSFLALKVILIIKEITKYTLFRKGIFISSIKLIYSYK
jgi:N-acetylglucosaminyl-diphospho-decaprenol L-rhamnosyltransferase